jgi:hypothetical protein
VAHVKASDRSGPPSRRAQLALASIAVVAVVVGGAAWWEIFRDRDPPIEGRIGDDLVPVVPLCVHAVEPPCRSVEDADRMVRSEHLVILAAEGTTGGNQGVVALALEDPSGERLKVKWRSAASESLFNTPAKELAAYHVQRLLLEPADYVVPPVASQCFELEHYRERVLESATPLAGTRCVLGFVTYWLSGSITMPEARRTGLWPMPPDGPDDDDPQLFDPQRFATDDVYRRNLAILNLVTHLVNNRDAHAGQFTLYTTPWHAFLIDNSLAFRAIPNPRTILIQDLSFILVPSIPESVATRLRTIERDELDALRVIEEYELRDGLLQRVEPGAPFEGDAFVRRAADRLQLGLPEVDVEDLWTRIVALRGELDAGRLTTF